QRSGIHAGGGDGPEHVRGVRRVLAAEPGKLVPALGKFHAGPAFAEEGSHAEARFIPAAEALLRRKGRDEADAGVKSAAYELQPYPLCGAAPAIGLRRGHGINICAAE